VPTVSRTRIAFDVPVRLVEGVATPGTERTIEQLDLGLDLGLGAGDPSVPTVRVILGRHGGREHVVHIEPEQGASGGASGGASDASAAPTRRRSLAVLLDELRDADGRLPVLVDGTPFTMRVLEALCAVPVGEQRTYAELAAASGRPRAVRAVASVMARNRTPLVLPCHRIVPSGGGTGRYGWGAGIKTALLDAEQRWVEARSTRGAP
jgi:O-6-methylguanine DNA methyltransferase